MGGGGAIVGIPAIGLVNANEQPLAKKSTNNYLDLDGDKWNKFKPIQIF